MQAQVERAERKAALRRRLQELDPSSAISATPRKGPRARTPLKYLERASYLESSLVCMSQKMHCLIRRSRVVGIAPHPCAVSSTLPRQEEAEKGSQDRFRAVAGQLPPEACRVVVRVHLFTGFRTLFCTPLRWRPVRDLMPHEPLPVSFAKLALTLALVYRARPSLGARRRTRTIRLDSSLPS